jgi:hypothetical protein
LYAAFVFFYNSHIPTRVGVKLEIPQLSKLSHLMPKTIHKPLMTAQEEDGLTFQLPTMEKPIKRS